jgi:hypothetical protein
MRIALRKTCRLCWMRGYLPSVLLILVGLSSSRWAFMWQGAPGPERRAMVNRGAFIYCWATNSTWCWTAPARWTLGSNYHQGRNHKIWRVKFELMWTYWPPDLDEALWPIVLQAGHVQVPVVYIAILTAAPAFAARFVRKRREPWMCPSCRYDRRGLPPGAACPECGGLPSAQEAA